MYLELLDIINQFEIQKYDDPVFNDPVTEDQIQNLVNESNDKLKYKPCEEYLDLLRLTDGYDNCNDDGVEFFSSDEFIDMNLEWRELEKTNDFIIFGSSSSAPIYTYNTKTNVYSIADRYYFSEKHDQIFQTFDDMLCAVLRPRINEISN